MTAPGGKTGPRRRGHSLAARRFHRREKPKDQPAARTRMGRKTSTGLGRAGGSGRAGPGSGRGGSVRCAGF